MPDDKKKIGAPDRARVSSQERYEVAALGKKFSLPTPLVQKVVEQVGPSRSRVEKKLGDMKRNGK